MAEDEAAEPPSADPFHRVGPATGDQLAPIRRALADWARAIGAAEDLIEEIVLATDEAMSNVISHAYPDRPGEFELRAESRPESGRIEITLRDQGRWQPPAQPDIRHGRGLPLIRALAEQASIEPSSVGTTVRMSWPLVSVTDRGAEV